MKIKTTISLSENFLRELDSIAGDRANRSALIESAIRSYLNATRRRRRDAADLDILNRNADALNAETEEMLEYLQ